jgi:hypothetical protein
MNNYGVTIETANLLETKKAIEIALNLKPEKIKSFADKAITDVRKFYTYENYKITLNF